MTRINLVDVEHLTDQHLFAEWREIKMVPASLRRSLKTRALQDVLKDIPSKFTLGTGHVTFFYDKMLFLFERYELLTQELKNRDYDVTEHNPTSIFYSDIPEEFRIETWMPVKEEVGISANRILEKIAMKPAWYKHYGSSNTLEYYTALYNFHLDTIV